MIDLIKNYYRMFFGDEKSVFRQYDLCKSCIHMTEFTRDMECRTCPDKHPTLKGTVSEKWQPR